MRIGKAAHSFRQAFVGFKKAFRWRYLVGFALLIPLFEVFRRISFSLPLALATAAPKGALMASLVAGSMLACLIMTMDAGTRRLRRVTTKATIGTALAVLSFACMATALARPEPSVASAFGIVAYVLLGGGIAFLFVGWVQAYALDGSLMVLLYVCTAMFLGNLGYPYIIAEASPWRLGAVLLACACMSGWCLYSFGLHEDPAVQPESANSRPLLSGKDPVAGRASGTAQLEQSVRSVRELLRPSVTTSALGFILGFYAWGSTAIPNEAYLNNHNALVYFVGNGLALVVMLAFVAFLQRSPRYGIARQRAFFLLPVFAVFMGYFSFIRMLGLEESGFLKNAIAIGYNMSLSGLWGLFIGMSAMQQHERGVSAERCVAPVLAAGSALFGLGLLLYELLGSNAMYMLIVFSTMYIICLSLISAQKASLNDDAALERRCDALAERHGLSAREAEVLLLIALGYSTQLIAEQLSISIETVRTHRKHIYAKMDVHGYEDLARTIHRRNSA